jgi:predicted DCC family thiol-disulfide oxidoreductase YuxK
MTRPDFPIILFDGACSFCNFWVRFIIRHDPKAVFRFAAYQSQTGQKLSFANGIGREKQESLTLITPAGIQQKSDAVLAIVEQFGGLWRLLRALKIVPRSWRDAIYDLVARNRYRWFGTQSACPIADQDRFV